MRVYTGNCLYYKIITFSIHLLAFLAIHAASSSAEATKGDLNHDGKVNFQDIYIVKNEFGRENCLTIPCNGDVNGDGKVDNNDVELIKAEFESSRLFSSQTAKDNHPQDGSDIDNSSTAEPGTQRSEIPADESLEASLRFKDTGNGTVIDVRTDLMWTKDANPATDMLFFNDALVYIRDMNAGKHANFGYGDWRLPTRPELQSLLDYTKFKSAGYALPQGHPFDNVKSIRTECLTKIYLSNAEYPWLFSCYCRMVGISVRSCFGCVWPVRNNK